MSYFQNSFIYWGLKKTYGKELWPVCMEEL